MLAALFYQLYNTRLNETLVIVTGAAMRDQILRGRKLFQIIVSSFRWYCWILDFVHSMTQNVRWSNNIRICWIFQWQYVCSRVRISISTYFQDTPSSCWRESSRNSHQVVIELKRAQHRVVTNVEFVQNLIQFLQWRSLISAFYITHYG